MIISIQPIRPTLDKYLIGYAIYPHNWLKWSWSWGKKPPSKKIGPQNKKMTNLVININFAGWWNRTVNGFLTAPQTRCNWINIFPIKNSRHDSPISRCFFLCQVNNLKKSWQQTIKLILLQGDWRKLQVSYKLQQYQLQLHMHSIIIVRTKCMI